MIRTAIVYGTRPEAIKLAPLSKLLQQDGRFVNKNVFTMQHENHAEKVFKLVAGSDSKSISLKPSLGSLSERMSHLMLSLEQTEATSRDNLDYLLIQGDTLTAFCGALHGFLSGIKIVHIEAGLRTANHLSPFPEEGLRRMITSMASLHFAPTQTAFKLLEKVASKNQKIFLSGNTVIDAVRISMEGTLLNQDKINRQVLITLHRRENWSKVATVASAILQLSEEFPKTTFNWIMHPNKEIQKIIQDTFCRANNVRVFEPQGYRETLSLISQSDLIMTDSGGIQEESTFFGAPLMILREETERPEVLQSGNGILVGANPVSIMEIGRKLLSDDSELRKMSTKSLPYGDGFAADKIVEHIYKDFQNRSPMTTE